MKDSITVLIASSILGKARSFTPQAIHRTLRSKCFIERTCFCSIKQMLKFILFATFFVCLSASCMPVEGPDDILINQPHYLCMTINGKERTVFKSGALLLFCPAQANQKNRVSRMGKNMAGMPLLPWMRFGRLCGMIEADAWSPYGPWDESLFVVKVKLP